MDSITSKYNLFWSACRLGEIDQVKDYIEKENLDYNQPATTMYGIAGMDETALHFACDQDQTEVALYLLSLPKIGESINKGDKLGTTPLMYAVAVGNEKIIKALLERSDIDIHLKDNNQSMEQTALFYLFYGWLIKPYFHSVLKLLMGKGINLNATNKEGNTFLMVLVHEEKSFNSSNANLKCEAIQTLLLLGADTSIQNNEGKTVFGLSTSERIKRILNAWNKEDEI